MEEVERKDLRGKKRETVVQIRLRWIIFEKGQINNELRMMNDKLRLTNKMIKRARKIMANMRSSNENS